MNEVKKERCYWPPQFKAKKLDKIGQEIFEKRYAYPEEKTYYERCKVMAHTMASAEKDEDKGIISEHFFDVLVTGDFVPGGRIIKGAGTKQQNMLNCYVLIPEDNVESIGKVIQDAYRISCAGGGIGFNFSKIRPKGDDVKHNKNSAPGSVSVMRMINEIGNHVRAGGNRRTALMGILNVTHPDILEFLHVKLDKKELNNFNISVAITNRFIEAVKNNEEWFFTFGNKKYYIYTVARNCFNIKDTSEFVKVVALNEQDALERANECYKIKFDDTFSYPTKIPFLAKDLWDMIWTNSVKSGDPGIYNIDLANEYTNVSYFERLESTNPSLRGDTLVLTPDGAVPIKEISEIKPNNKFFTFNGEWADGICRKSGENKRLYKITFSGNKEIFCTPEHKWPILKENPNYKRDGTLLIDYSTFTKVETANIIPGMKILLPDNLEINNTSCLYSREDGFTLGWNIGDGYRTYRKDQKRFIYGFVFSPEDYDSGIANKVLEHISSKKSGIKSTLRFHHGCYELYEGSKEIANYFEELGNYGKESGIPESVFRGNKEFIKGFVDGLFSSDGYVDSKQNRIVLVSAHKKLVEDMQKLLLMFGISSSYKYSVSKLEGYGEYDRYDLVLTTTQAIKFSKKFDLSHVRKQSSLKEIGEHKTNRVNGQEYLLIKSVELTDQYEDVYDITVFDSTHTFAMESGITSNCGEISLPNYGNCCLGNINLANMVIDGQFDWKRFARSIRYGIQFLDNVLEVNHFPISECKEAGHRSRRIGLGVMGYHYMLIKLGIKYGSEKCLEFTELLGKAMRDIAYLKSAYLSREKGPFPAFRAKEYLAEGFAKTLPARIRMLISEHGIRNAVMLTIPPTGTISMLMGVSSGIEPIFSPIYKRRWRDSNVWKEAIVIDPLLRSFHADNLPLDPFVGAYDITPREHLAVQACWQKFIDSCISKTINLRVSVESVELTDLALEYVEYLKGLTIYRQNSKEMEPLEQIDLTKENLDKYMESQEIEIAVTDGALCKIGGECGS